MSKFDEDVFGASTPAPTGYDPAIFSASPTKSEPAKLERQVEDPGAMKTGLIAAGRATDQIVKGVQQLYYKATDNKQGLAELDKHAAADDEIYGGLKKLRPWSTGIGEAAPDAAMMVGTGGGGALPLLFRSAVAGAAPGLIKYGTGEERVARGVVGGVGGVVGAAGGLALNKVLSPAGTPAVSNGVSEAAGRLGYKPTAAQLTQNPAMGNLENYLSRSPGSSGIMQRAAQANQTALNTSAAKAMGETASDLSEGTFNAAKTRIGGEFSRLGQVTQPQLGNDFLNSLAHIDAANKAKGPFANKAVDSLIDKGLDLASRGNLSGTAYKEIRTELSNAAQAAFKGGDASAGQAYKQVVSALDDAAKGSLSAADKEAWDVARSQWAAFKTLSKGNVAEAGNVSAPRVASVVRRTGDSFRTGQAQGPLIDIGRIGEAFKGVQNPNSGNLGQSMLYGNPVTGAPLALGNNLAARAYMSPIGQKYMSGGLLNVGPTGQMLTARGAGLLGAPAGLGLLNVE